MLAQTIGRLADLVPAKDVLVITNTEQRDAVLEVCPELDPNKVIGEPVGRDTAAAVGLATVLVRREDPEAVFAMLPADAVIHDAAGLCATLESAFAAAEADPVLATIGITASFPATGYGYIQQGNTRGDSAGQAVYQVKRFVEKPDLATAQSYLEAGGLFLERRHVYLVGLSHRQPSSRKAPPPSGKPCKPSIKVSKRAKASTQSSRNITQS
jgi:mannose-1-phosphate guanylyltransferase